MSKRAIPSKAKKQTVTTNYSLRSKSGSVTLQEDSGIMNNTEKAYAMDIEPNDDDVLHTTNNANPTNADIMTLLRSMNSKLKKLDTIEADITGLKKDIASVNSEISDIDDRVKTLEDNENSAIHRYNEALKRHQISALNNEYNSKEYNVIIYNRPGVGKKETPVASLAIVYDILRNVLQIDDPDFINIANAHRLPGKNEKRLPLIFKLTTMFDKKKIWNNIKNLNAFNNGKDDKEKIFIQMNHLPKKLMDDRKSLLEDYKEPKVTGKRPKWRFIKSTGEYCYIIGKDIYRPKVNNFNIIS